MKSEQFLKEGFVEDAHEVHQDHEVQMAREECYHTAENAIALHKLLRHVSEQQGLEGWVSAKITLANDYLKTVREYLEYELMTGGTEGNETPLGVVSAAPVAEMLPVAEGTPSPTPQWSDEQNAKRQQSQKEKAKAQFLKKKEKKGVAEDQVNEMSAGSVATVVNPPAKNKAKVGSLFGGTYKQSKTKAK